MSQSTWNFCSRARPKISARMFLHKTISFSFSFYKSSKLTGNTISIIFDWTFSPQVKITQHHVTSIKGLKLANNSKYSSQHNDIPLEKGKDIFWHSRDFETTRSHDASKFEQVTVPKFLLVFKRNRHKRYKFDCANLFAIPSNKEAWFWRQRNLFMLKDLISLVSKALNNRMSCFYRFRVFTKRLFQIFRVRVPCCKHLLFQTVQAKKHRFHVNMNHFTITQ